MQFQSDIWWAADMEELNQNYISLAGFQPKMVPQSCELTESLIPSNSPEDKIPHVKHPTTTRSVMLAQHFLHHLLILHLQCLHKPSPILLLWTMACRVTSGMLYLLFQYWQPCQTLEVINVPDIWRTVDLDPCKSISLKCKKNIRSVFDLTHQSLVWANGTSSQWRQTSKFPQNTANPSRGKILQKNVMKKTQMKVIKHTDAESVHLQP